MAVKSSNYRFGRFGTGVLLVLLPVVAPVWFVSIVALSALKAVAEMTEDLPGQIAHLGRVCRYVFRGEP